MNEIGAENFVQLQAEATDVVETDTPQWRGWLERVGDDWWATLLAGVIVALAVADVLPKIPW